MASIKEFMEKRREHKQQRQHVRETLSENNENFW